MEKINEDRFRQLVTEDGKKTMVFLTTGMQMFDKTEDAMKIETEGITKYEMDYYASRELREVLFENHPEGPCVIFLLDGKAMCRNAFEITDASVIDHMFYLLQSPMFGSRTLFDLRSRML